MEHHFDIEVAQKVGTNCAVILHNITYWIKKNEANKKHFHDGRYWTYNSIAAFTELFPYMSPKVIRGCLEKLKKKGYLISKNLNKFKYDRTFWYALAPINSHLPKCINGFAPEGKPIPDKKLQIKTINTSFSEMRNDVVSFLFNSRGLKELKVKLTSLLTGKERKKNSAKRKKESWRQLLCSAFNNFKRVDEIWERSRDLLYISVTAPLDDPVELTSANLNFLDLLLREGRELTEIREKVATLGWYNYKIERGHEVYFNK